MYCADKRIGTEPFIADWQAYSIALSTIMWMPLLPSTSCVTLRIPASEISI